LTEELEDEQEEIEDVEVEGNCCGNVVIVTVSFHQQEGVEDNIE